MRSKEYDLMRISSASNFVFEYDLPPYKNGSSPILLNVTNAEMSVLKFKIYDIIDIGGTLTLGFAIKPDIDTKKEASPNVTIIACINKDTQLIPTLPDQCTYTYSTANESAPVILNSTESETLHLVHVPFPDPGIWFITLRAFYEDCLTCKCMAECQKLYDICLLDCELSCNETCDNCIEKCKTKALVSKDCSSCDCDGKCSRKKDEESRNTSLIFTVGSNACIEGQCGSHGKCNNYIVGGFIYSSCHCFGGYRGKYILRLFLVSSAKRLFVVNKFSFLKQT